jgi:hypothetical protein
MDATVPQNPSPRVAASVDAVSGVLTGADGEGERAAIGADADHGALAGIAMIASATTTERVRFVRTVMSVPSFKQVNEWYWFRGRILSGIHGSASSINRNHIRYFRSTPRED